MPGTDDTRRSPASGSATATAAVGDAVSDAAGKTADKAEQVGDSAALEIVARVGLVAYGAVHLLIGWLALQIAWRSGAGQSADTSGALKTLAEQPFGRILLWLIAIGLAALALWQASASIWGYHDRGGAKRILARLTSAAKAAVYAGLGVSAASVALGSGSSSSQSQQEATSGVLGWPGGTVIVVGAAVIIVGVGVASVVKGVRRSFAEEINTASLSPTAHTAITRLGQVGYIAKGVALAVVGALLAYATLTVDYHNGQGLDGALEIILAQPFGRFLLTAVALGFAAFGLFALLQSRYRRM